MVPDTTGVPKLELGNQGNGRLNLYTVPAKKDTGRLAKKRKRAYPSDCPGQTRFLDSRTKRAARISVTNDTGLVNVVATQ